MSFFCCTFAAGFKMDYYAENISYTICVHNVRAVNNGGGCRVHHDRAIPGTRI